MSDKWDGVAEALRTVDAAGMKRFRRLVRSKVREHATQLREPPPLTMYVSAGDRPGKAAAVRIGAARTAEEVAQRARDAMLEARPSFAAIVRQLHAKDTSAEGRRAGRTAGLTHSTGLVVASRAGLVETWSATFRAGVLSSWREGEFDPGVTVALMRSAWVEIDRVEHLEGLVERLRVLGERSFDVDDEQVAVALRGKLGDLGEGCMAYLGDKRATPPREPEREFTAYVERWLETAERGMGVSDNV